MNTTADTLVPEQLWQIIHPLLPTPLCRYGGRPRIDDRACLAGIVYQLRTGVPWQLPSASLAAAARSPAGGGCGTSSALASGSSSTTCCSSSSAATASWTGPAPVSTRSACAPSGGCLTGPNPTDRGKPGSKYHLQVDRNGTPLAACLSAANTHDSMLLEQVLDTVAPVKGPRGRPGRPRKRPSKLHLDKGPRLPALPAGAAPTRDHAADRPAWHRVQPAARPPPVRGGAVAGLAGGPPAVAGPLRATG